MLEFRASDKYFITVLFWSQESLSIWLSILWQGNRSTATPYVEKIERELTQMGFPYKRFDRQVPSFAELYPCLVISVLL